MNPSAILSCHRRRRRARAVLAACAASACWLAGAALAPARAADAASAASAQADPFGSLAWPDLRRTYLQNEPVRFDARVRVQAPTFADDAMNVPVQFDATALASEGGGIDRILVLVDRNPIRQVLEFAPRLTLATLALRFKLEQASPVRVIVRTRDGVWHAGGVQVDASGGGCTLPGNARADANWTQTLNQVQARIFGSASAADGKLRLRARIMHPMDTGLVAGVPSFHLETLELRDAAGALWMRMRLFEPVAENPVFSFDLPATPAPAGLRFAGRDNNGNALRAAVP